MPDTFYVGSTNEVYVPADSINQVKIINGSGGTLYYKSTTGVSSSSNDGNLTAGQTLGPTATGQFVIASTGVNCIVEKFTSFSGPDVSATDDLTVTDDATITDTLTVTGATTLTGGVAQAVSAGFRNVPVVSATGGTDTAFANGTQFVTSIFVPVNKTITNVNYLVGSVGGTDKVYAVVYNAAGTNVGNSSLTGGGATVGTAAEIQTLALTSTYAAKGPAHFFVGISANGNTAKIRTVPAHMQSGIKAGSVSQTHGTVAAITAPTSFTADKAPYVFVD